MRDPAHPPPPRPPGRQLPLPLAPPATRPAAPTSLPLVAVATPHVWRSLSPAAQAHLRQTLRQILEEVVHDGPER